MSRRLFGSRHEPSVAVERLGERIGAAARSVDLLPAIVEAIATTLRLPYVAVRTDGPGDEVSVGSPSGPVLEVPLACQRTPVGTLMVSGRSNHEPLSRADREVLEQLAVHVALAVQAVTLTVEIERSRARLVASQEEERRRLRRDLHDELGPALTAIGFGIDTVDNLVTRGAPTADVHALLARLRGQADDAIGEIRRVAYALRPPLDELGLSGALSAQAESLSRGGLHVQVSVDGAVDTLSAAVEAAAYRIGVEAMTNAARHAKAVECHVMLHVADAVTLEITDDGTGLLPGCRTGVGLSSMRERAAELGGWVDIGAGENAGCRVRALLPLGPIDE